MANDQRAANETVLVTASAFGLGTLPKVCALTGATNTLPWPRTYGRVKGSLPIREDLVRTFDKRHRLANRALIGFGASWGAAILLAILVATIPSTGSTAGPVAGLCFLGGLVIFLVAVATLTQMVGTIPLRCRLVVGSDDRQYLKIVNASSAFAAALAQHGSKSAVAGSTADAVPEVRVTAPATVRARFVANPRALATYLLVYTAIWAWILVRDVQRHDYLVIAVVSMLGIAFALVAIALKWQPRIGKFVLTPAKTVAMILVGALSGAFGLISSLTPGQSSSADPMVGAVVTVSAMVIFVVAGAAYSNIRAKL